MLCKMCNIIHIEIFIRHQACVLIIHSNRPIQNIIIFTVESHPVAIIKQTCMNLNIIYRVFEIHILMAYIIHIACIPHPDKNIMHLLRVLTLNKNIHIRHASHISRWIHILNYAALKRHMHKLLLSEHITHIIQLCLKTYAYRQPAQMCFLPFT